MIFSLFKKRLHEPEEQQRQEVRNEPIGPLALAGEDCDEISKAQGPFGHSYNNPIPVNGLLGAYKYLGKLISPVGNIIYFHRIGSIRSDTAANRVDAYEIVDMAGGYWDILFIDMYHPRRSNKAPEGYRLKTYDSKIGDIPFAFGVDIFCPRFPYDLPDAIEQRNNLAAFARRVRERVSQGCYNRPQNQEMKVMTARSRLLSMQG